MRNFALHPCIRLAPCRGQTMKQSIASAARLRGGGPILTKGSMTMLRLGSPPPRIVIGQQAVNFETVWKVGVLWDRPVVVAGSSE